MRINTITCHDVYNHGASLQAYALQQYLVSQGNDNEIINYKPPYLSGHYKLWKISSPAWNKNFITRLIYLVLKLPGRLFALKRKKAFDQFTTNNLKLTPNRYTSNEDLKQDCPEADMYIAGSDQIWNTIFQNGKDPAFYLDFVPEGKRRISYAASFATEKIIEDYEDFVKGMVNKIDCISVREQTGVELLKELGVNRAVQVCDPVFLLDKEKWENIASTIYTEKYLLIYDAEKSELLKKIACTLALRLNLKIYSIGPYSLSYAKRNFPFAGPVEFVSLIKNANYIISNSFHGTAFSIIFEKNMCVVNRTEAINTRMQNLVESLGISNRLVGADFNIDELIEKVDYSNVNNYLFNTILSSKKFLKESIGNKT